MRSRLECNLKYYKSNKLIKPPSHLLTKLTNTKRAERNYKIIVKGTQKFALRETEKKAKYMTASDTDQDKRSYLKGEPEDTDLEQFNKLHT